jgi:hypothetical protein
MGEMRNAQRVLIRNPQVSDHSEDLGVDERAILEWVLERQGEKMWSGCIGLRIGTSGGPL